MQNRFHNTSEIVFVSFFYKSGIYSKQMKQPLPHLIQSDCNGDVNGDQTCHASGAGLFRRRRSAAFGSDSHTEDRMF